jgi:uncharacterized protein YkwD
MIKSLLTTLIASLALTGSAQAALDHKPAAERPCRPALAPCDATVEVINDRGIPQTASLLLAADVNNPDFNPGIGPAPLAYVSERGQLSFNLNPGSYYYYTQVDKLGRRYGRIGPFRLPLPSGADPYRVEIINYGISAGTSLLLTRNTYIEGQDWSDTTLFPEKRGVSYRAPSAGSSATVTVPSFGFPQNTPQLTDRERGALGLLNDARRDQGLNPLPAQPDLNAAADGYACWLSTSEAHGSSVSNLHTKKGQPSRRADDYGWQGGVNETIAWGQYSPESGFQTLIDSSYHAEILFDPTAEFLGLGFGCNHLIITVSSITPLIDPVGGFGSDLGDPSLARWDDDDQWQDSPAKSVFRPQVILRRPGARRPMLVVKVNGSSPNGRLFVRQGGRVKKSTNRTLTMKLRHGKRIRVWYQASKRSATAGGRMTYCLKSKKGKKVIRRCR